MRLMTAILLIGGLALMAFWAACGGESSAGLIPGPAPGGGSLQAGTSGGLQGISVSGQGTVLAEPDTALLSLGVSVLANTARGARDRAAEAMSDLLDSLRDNGVDKKDIKTTQFSLNPEYDYRSGSPQLRGYRVTNTVSVKVRALGRTAEIIDEAVEVVGDPIQIGGIAFTVDDPKPLLSQARAEAMADAKAKAQELAQLAGLAMGKPIAINESSVGLPPILIEGARAADLAQATPIQPGQLAVSVNVQVTYAIG